jgi:hypothetical protein
MYGYLAHNSSADLLLVVVREEEEVMRDPSHGREVLDGAVVAEVGVDVRRHERGDLGPHAVLHAEPAAVHAVADHALEQRLVVPRQPLVRRRRLQLVGVPWKQNTSVCPFTTTTYLNTFNKKGGT